jgi:hypothetical protein
MRVPETILKSVVFLGHFAKGAKRGNEEQLILGGTAFVVSIPGLNPEILYRYLVTARHSVLKLSGKDAAIRVNTDSGSHLKVRIDDKWWFHHTEEKSVDIAVRPFCVKDCDIVSIPHTNFLTDEKISENYIGQGDEVSVTGLFTKSSGASRNMPIVRRGSLAMLPDENIPIVMGDGNKEAEVYLIEVRSVGGLSGSPAFVRAPVGIPIKVHTKSGQFREAKTHLQGDYWLLGLTHGHWEILPDDKNKSVDNSILRKKNEETINLGIAIVVPAKKILEVLDHPELIEMRKKENQPSEEEGVTTPDFEDDSHESFSKSDFESALKKASRKRKEKVPNDASRKKKPDRGGGQ